MRKQISPLMKWKFICKIGLKLFDAACPAAQSGRNIVTKMKHTHYEAALRSTGQWLSLRPPPSQQRQHHGTNQPPAPGYQKIFYIPQTWKALINISKTDPKVFIYPDIKHCGA